MDKKTNTDEELSTTLPSFRVWLCGTFRIERRVGTTYEGVRVTEWGGSNYPRLLLKALLCCSGRQARREAVMDMLWPEVEFEQAMQYRNTATTKLRTLLRPTKGKDSFLITEDDANSYQLADQSRLWVDTDAALALLKQVESRGRTSLESVTLLEEATKYFNRGVFLDGEEGLWASGKRATIERARYRCRLWLAEAYEQQGMVGQAEAVLSEILEEDPTDEDVLHQLIELLRQQGMRHQALRLYEQVSDKLMKEGIKPALSMKNLAARLYEEHHERSVAPTTTTKTTPDLSESVAQGRERAKRKSPDSLLQHMLSSKGRVTLSSTRMPAIPDTPQIASFDYAQPLCIDETTSDTLMHFSSLTDACRHLSEGNELQAAEHTLWAYLPRVETIAKLSFEDQLPAADITSQGYLLAASLAGHRNDLQARHRYSEQALLYGKLAGDRNLQIAALRQLSITFDYLERPDKVLQIYQQAFPYLNEVSPLLRACVYAGVSGAYAQLKQKREALHFMSLAYEHFPAHPENEPNFLHTICRYSTLIFFDGLNYLDLGQPHEAEKVLARIDGLHPQVRIPERVRIEALNYQIEVFITLNSLEQACTYLEAAVHAALIIGSERRLQESFALFQRMKETWHNESRVKDLTDLFIR